MTLDGRYRQLYDRQYGMERDRYINPGEDPTPESTSALEDITVVARADGDL